MKAVTADRGFNAKLSLYDGEWRESGGGMRVRVFVDRDWDRVVIDVAGANPALEQTVLLQLWAPRSPAAMVGSNMVLLAEHWRDDRSPGGSGLPFGSLSALRVVGREVRAEKISSRCVALHFRAQTDGRFRVIAAAPAFDGSGNPQQIAAKILRAPVDESTSRQWWNDFWNRAGLINAWSADGSARYFETLRTLFLYASAAQSGGAIPGSQAGIADLFSSVKDGHFWDPAAFWGWNLRMQVGANLDAGLPELNEPFFALYRNNLPAIRRWTLAKMSGREGICVPETMRFNGVGIEFEGTEFRPFSIITHSCDGTWTSTSNARTLTTGAEVGLWVWETYLKTRDRAFLETNYPLMAEAARFLLAYQTPGADGLLHTHPSNAHETQHDVTDPTTDLAAIRTLYPATMQAAQELGRDADLARRLAAALGRTPALPLADSRGDPDSSSPTTLQTAGKVIAPSYEFNAPARNHENIGLEPVWPYALIDANSPMFDTARRTFVFRPFRALATWSYDPVHAARLGFGAALAQSLYTLTQIYQIYPNGMGDLGGGGGEFYIEQMGVVALALSEALVQDTGEDVWIAPAAPPGWSMQGTGYVRGNGHVAVEVQDGQVVRFELRAGSTHRFRIHNPWGTADVVETISGVEQATRITAPIILIDAKAGEVYRFQRESHGSSPNSLRDDATAAAQSLGRVSIGLGGPCCAAPAYYDPAKDDRSIGRP